MHCSSDAGVVHRPLVNYKNPMMTKLPLIMAGGTFKTLNSMPEDQLEKFLGYVTRFTSQKYGKSLLNQPSWWTENVLYLPDFCLGRVPLPYTRNKSVKLRRLIRLCYIAHGSKDLLSLSEKLAALHVLSYKFIRNADETITVVQVSTRAPIVMIPSSNLDYDLDDTLGKLQREITIIPIRKTLIAYDTKSVKPVHDEDNCIIIEDSSSDDDVEIISYEAGAFPSVRPPLKRKLPNGIRPGPACSKVPLKALKAVSASAKPPTLPVKTRSVPQRTRDLSSTPGTVPRPAVNPIAPAPKTAAVKKYLRVRNARHLQGQQTDTFTNIDLTIDHDEDDDPEKTARLPTDLTQNSFLIGFSLLGKGCKPLQTKMPPIFQEKKSKMLNMKNLSIDLVPFMVDLGLLPNRSLCSQRELDQRTAHIERHTRKDYECSRIAVNVSDKAAVASVVRCCTVRLIRLNSADLRKWKKSRAALRQL